VPPVLSTTPVSLITAISASSGGSVTDDGGAPIISRGVCWNTSDNPEITNNKTSDGEGLGTYTSNLTQLIPNTTYFIRAYATNRAGTSYGSSIQFKTLGDKPVVTTASATEIRQVTAKLNGIVNPNYLSTTVFFEFGLTTNYGATITPNQSLLNGDSNINIDVTISSLTPGKTYHYRIKAINSLGTTYSNDISFTTLGQVPTAISKPATNLLTTTATINGSVNQNYLFGPVTFEWGTTTNYGNVVTPSGSPSAGNGAINFSVNLSGLTPATTYHFRISATNELGTTQGDDMEFKTQGYVPTITDLYASNISLTSATMNGIVNPNYLPTTVTIEYGYDTNYGNIIQLTNDPVIGNSNFYFYKILDGLQQLSIVHFRLKAVNQLGTTTSDDRTFSTIGVVSDYDGNYYQAIVIGDQRWMTSNLKTKHFANGDPVFNGETVSDNCDQKPYYFNYNTDINNTTTYGLLYNYYAASNSNTIEPINSNSNPSGIQGACPTGWHLPSIAEYQILIDFLGGSDVAGGKLKSLQLWDRPNLGVTNSGSFNALPAGGYDKLNFNYDYLGKSSYFWSTTGGPDDFKGLRLGYSSTNASITVSHRCTGYSIRCLKD
jgi:uncharacterized protein (TIGR02145 family)